MDNRITIGITGASGAPYAMVLIKSLLSANWQVHLVISNAGRMVLADEIGLNLPANISKAKTILCERLGASEQELHLYGLQDWTSVIASGSSAPKNMVICPCTGGTLSSVATGASNNLIERGADVVLKEKGKLIMLFRELPLSLIHIENMKTVTLAGACVMPASPGFYHHPKDIDDLVNFVVGRILDQLDIPQDLIEPWGYTKH